MMSPSSSTQPSSPDNAPVLPNVEEQLIQRIRDIPSLPSVVDHILSLMNNPETPASRISDLIAFDPGLTSKVLRMVNSAAYGVQRHISSIQHGIMILGFNTVRGIVLSASVLKLFDGKSHPGGLDHEAFWWHSTATALAAQAIAKQKKLPIFNEAFTAGMLHDIGKLVLDVYFSKQYLPILKQAHIVHGDAFYAIETDLMDTNHGNVGARLGEKWKLPKPIIDVIEHHHHPDQATENEMLVHVVCVANDFARLAAYHNGVFSMNECRPESMTYLGIDEDQADDLFRTCTDAFGDIDSLFNS